MTTFYSVSLADDGRLEVICDKCSQPIAETGACPPAIISIPSNLGGLAVTDAARTALRSWNEAVRTGQPMIITGDVTVQLVKPTVDERIRAHARTCGKQPVKCQADDHRWAYVREGDAVTESCDRCDEQREHVHGWRIEGAERVEQGVYIMMQIETCVCGQERPHNHDWAPSTVPGSSRCRLCDTWCGPGDHSSANGVTCERCGLLMVATNPAPAESPCDVHEWDATWAAERGTDECRVCRTIRMHVHGYRSFSIGSDIDVCRCGDVRQR